jgi:flagellar hook-associated protein 2
MSTVSGTGTLSSAGLGSGLDVTSIISKLVQIESQPIANLQQAAQGLNSQLSSIGQIKSYMSALRDAAAHLTDLSLWKGTTASSSDTSSIAATASAGAAAGTYNVQVSKLAQAEGVASGAFASSSATVGQGVMTIALGSWDTNQTTFTPKAGSTAVQITVDPTDTLAQVRDKINNANAGVVASIVTDSSGARLSIQSKDSGANNAFRIQTQDGGDGNDTDAAGLSALAYDPPSGTQGTTRTQIGADAQATINGIPITSSSNTLSNVLDGLSLTLSKTTTSAVTVTVATDKDSISKAVNDFATAYNNAMKYLRQQTAYDASSKTAGPLQGNTTVVSMISQLRSLASGTTGASSVLSRLSDIGLTPQKDGTLSVDSTKLSAAMSNLPELQKALAASVPTGGASTGGGFAQQFQSYGDGLLSFDGVLQASTDGLNARIKSNTDQQSQMQDRVDAYQERITKLYQSLDTQMANLNGLSSYVSQQMSLLSKSK